MIDFWGAVLALLVIAAALLAVPLMRGTRPGRYKDEPRTDVNLAVYEERLAALREAHQAGTLDAQALEAAEAEAARALLADVPSAATPATQTTEGRRVLWAVTALVPLAALALYLQFGALDRVRLSRELATPAATPAQRLDRLERTVEAQPDAPDALFMLARTYMTQNRAREAVPLFERAAQLAGRPPALLGQWAQAEFFASDRKWSAHIQRLVDEALAGNPNEGTSLGLLGIAAFEGQHWAAAIAYWQRLQAGLSPTDPARAALQTGIERARQAQQGQGGGLPVASGLRIKLRLAPRVAQQVKPDDAVFVFARAAAGPRIPLAVKRLRVGDLPTEVTLSDADAMQPGLKLSAFEGAQVMARISRSGEPTQGQWTGTGKPVAGEPNTFGLTIDTPEN